MPRRKVPRVRPNKGNVKPPPRGERRDVRYRQVKMMARRKKLLAYMGGGPRTYREMAAYLGCDVHTAYQDWQEINVEYQKAMEEQAPHVLGEHDAVLRESLRTALNAMRSQSPLNRLEAIDRVVKVEARHARLLGIDKPIKVAQTDPTGEFSASIDLTKLSDQTLQALLKELASKD